MHHALDVLDAPGKHLHVYGWNVADGRLREQQGRESGTAYEAFECIWKLWLLLGSQSRKQIIESSGQTDSEIDSEIDGETNSETDSETDSETGSEVDDKTARENALEQVKLQKG